MVETKQFNALNTDEVNSLTKPKVIVYADGACSGNPGPGGWGAWLQCNGVDKELYGYEIDTTNNRMEIMAVIEALKALKKTCIIEIYTDSKYVQQGITIWIHKWLSNNWCKSNNDPIKNAELWQILYNESKKHDIIWHWVKGHAGINGNEIADRLAVRGRDIAKKLLLEQQRV